MLSLREMFRLPDSRRARTNPSPSPGSDAEMPRSLVRQAESARRVAGMERDSPAAQHVVLHVGFGHAGTTSLQLNFFSHRPDFHYLASGNLGGGFLSRLKYVDDCRLAPGELESLCSACVRGNAGRPVVISDETLTDCAEVFFAPRLLPATLVAARLKQCFPHARIVFTLRRPAEYVASMYFNLKRNYAFLAGVGMPPFEEWWAGMQSQEACWYLGNLDYAPVVERYADLFGDENVLLLPLEELKAAGPAAYLNRLCRFMEVPFREEDVARFQVPQNTRMTVVEERVAELIASRDVAPLVRKALENGALAGLIGDATRTELRLPDHVVQTIESRAAAGNRRLVERFAVPLHTLGYPV